MKSLTPQQAIVCQRICAGQIPTEIADDLCLRKRTIDFHIACIHKRWGVRNVAQMYTEAMRQGVVQPPERVAE